MKLQLLEINYDIHTCLNEASYSVSQPIWASFKDETFEYFLVNSNRCISLQLQGKMG